MPSPNKGPPTLKRLVLHMNTQTLSLPSVTVTRDRDKVVLTSVSGEPPRLDPKHRDRALNRPHLIVTNLGLVAKNSTVLVYRMDGWNLDEPIGVIVGEESNPKTPKLPYFISRLLGVISLEDYETQSIRLRC